MADTKNTYEGDMPTRSGARNYIPGNKFRKVPCNKMYNPDGTLTGEKCPYGSSCTFRHPLDESRSKTKDCSHVKPDGTGCKHGDSCSFRHPGDPGFGESVDAEQAEPVNTKKPIKGHAKHSVDQPKIKTMPDGITYTAMLESLTDVIANHPVVSAVLDDKKDILKLIKALTETTKKVDIIFEKTRNV